MSFNFHYLLAMTLSDLDITRCYFFIYKMGTFFLGGGFNLKKGWTKPDTFYYWVNEAGREGINGRNTARIFCFLSY